MSQQFRQTEAGEIPVDWECRELGSFCSVSSGGTPNRQQPQYWDGHIPWITTSQIDYRPIAFAHESITEAGLKNSAAKMYPPDTLLMAMYGQGKTRGKVALTKIAAAINQACAAIAVSPPISTAFVFQSLAARYRQIRELSNAGSQENLNGALIRSIPCALPPTTAEQETIAEVLSDADALIESLERLIAKKRDIKQGAVQELLTGKTRLPGFAHTNTTKPSPIGDLPADWDAVPVGDLLEFKNGLNKGKSYFGSGTPIINYMDVFEHPGLLAAEVRGLVTVDPDEQRNYSAKLGDVFFTRTSETVQEIGIAAVLLEDIPDAVFSGFVLRGRPISTATSLSYRKYCFESHAVRKQIVATASYTTRALTNGRLLSIVLIPLPSSTLEQDAIAGVIADMDSELAGLEQKLSKVRQTKMGMMHELLTGRIRLV